MAAKEGLSTLDTANSRGNNRLGLLNERKARMVEAWGKAEIGRRGDETEEVGRGQIIGLCD